VTTIGGCRLGAGRGFAVEC